MTATFSLLVVDDEPDLRTLYELTLLREGYEVETAGSVEEAWSQLKDRTYSAVITDMRLPGADGLSLVRHCHGLDADLPVIMITGHGDVPMAVNTMKKGALDFIQKPFKEDELLNLVERMLEHAKGAFAEYQSAASRDALLAKLTSREAQVLERIVAGRLNKQIADDLGISIKTVEAHRANIMEKLGANTVADLLKIALGKDAVKA